MKVIKEGGHRLFEKDHETAKAVTEILLDIEKNGMDAIRKYSKKFDDWNPDSFELTDKQVNEAIAQVDDQTIEDTDFAQSNIRNFAKAQLETMKPLEIETAPGVILGHKHIPVQRSSSYIPGGRYPMFGSAQMSIIPAKVAGVKEVYAFTPPVKGEGPYPATINAMKKAGADRIFVLGGVPAFAMATFGIGGIDPVDIVCGAGNRFVAEAKRQLYGQVGIDLLAGPTEIMVIADEKADPEIVAADLLGQAEHDPNSGIALISLDEEFANIVHEELKRQLEVLPTRDIAKLSWEDNGKIYVAESKEEAVKLSDDYAPEHLELQVEDLDYFFENLNNYGSLFIGEETTVAYGDKTIGTNHILPTSRSGRYTGGLWVGKFLKTVTYQRMTKEASIKCGEVTERLCNAERMLAHGITAKMRVDKYSNQ